MTVPLGPLRLTARILSSPAGVVYAAVDPAGRQVQVALLTRGAASDPAARDRFAAAVRESGGAVLAADTDDPGPWAVGTGNLAGLLEPVLLRDHSGQTGQAGQPGQTGQSGQFRGPRFLHHWAGAQEPAFPTGRGPSGSAPTLTPPPRWTVGGPLGSVLAVIALILLFLLVLFLLVWLYLSQPAPVPVEPAEPTPTTSQPSSPSPSPSPSEGPGSPTPSPSGSGSSPSTPEPGTSGPGQWPTPGGPEGPGGDNPL